MKKEYISPIASMILFETGEMIATSTLESNPGDNVNVEFTNEEYSGQAASRRRNVWADEELDMDEEF